MDVALSTGYTPDYVGWNIDLPRLISMRKFWDKHPPMIKVLAAFAGYKAPATVDKEIESALNKSEEERKADLATLFGEVKMATFQKPVAYTTQAVTNPDAK